MRISYNFFFNKKPINKKEEEQKQKEANKNPSQWDNLGFLIEELREKNKHKNLLLPPQDPKYQGKLTLVIELDDILVHTFQPDEHEAYLNAPLRYFLQKIRINNKKKRDHDFYFELKEYDTYVSVYKRPYLDDFLKYIRENHEAILFTRGVKEYCSKVLELIDPEKSFAHILTNEDCDRVIYEPEDMDEYVKDLQRLGRDMKKVVYIDNQPINFWTAPDNAFPIPPYFGELNNDDQSFKEIQESLNYLSSLDDVREYLQEEFQIKEILKSSRFL
ncbi:NLI interacting factor-like phosphatase family protein, putative [Ichthyophthirius multifiliis]|uniref:Mitochondrial import inner membrane translocase subunit TIM50 n=1 Tax=Ichthyophthirius multifiliis TaxID=5932 RepID=G0R2B4_ICHMU|nr:NLI interacting factor-like phosphatase family protein, putative [Ichthyophthirius multifiliis]EGR28390.1 NLI interacting factor-like phosphatase family protein, putative [Ichthyophthirius multifiliis]|eukprot:XP_004027735.1 NLI interacting factor-like phosphatase family protein, putative [Ichthyophthirius multifiliis]